MPTDTELRALFHEAPAPESRIDPARVIRRSRRRRLPQQVSAGGVLTLAVAGIGVAGISGLQGLAPSSTGARVSADAPMGTPESAPFAGTDSSTQRLSCGTGGVGVPEVRTGLQVAPLFPATASTGQTVSGALTLTNTGAEPVTGTALAPMVGLSRDGATRWHGDAPAAGRRVALAAGESTTLAFSFDAVDCDARDEGAGAPLERGDYTLAAVLTLVPDDGPSRLIGGPASAITLR